jgi:triosephosphate isomerase (TIM)
MKKHITPLIIGNWKMNPNTSETAIALAKELKTALVKIKDVEVVVSPPSIYLESVKKIRNGSHVYMLGAQNVHSEKNGPYTGEISLSMLTDVGVSHVIVGHSERRQSGETDEQVRKKLHAILKAGLVPIVCIGEYTRDESAHYLSFIEHQIRHACAGISRSKLNRIVIAYEPIWAIGTGNTATSEDVHEMFLFIKKTLSDMYGRNYASHIRIIYGGSVHEKNAKQLFVQGAIDGFLVGGASIHTREFVGIINMVRSIE